MKEKTREELIEIILSQDLKIRELIRQRDNGLANDEIKSKAETIKHDLYWRASREFVDELVAEIIRLRALAPLN